MKIKINPKQIDKFAVILLTLFVFIYFGKTLFPKSGEIIYGGDLLTQFYYWKGFLKDNLLRGVIPFWNPYLFSGTPFLAHPGVAAFYPASLLYLILPLNTAFSLNYFLHLLIGGSGMYFLAKQYADRLSAFMAASLFSFSGFFTARIYAGHVDLLTTAVWIPWIIYFLVRKNLKGLVISLSLLILAGYSAYLVFTCLFIILFIAFRFLISRKYFFRPLSALIFALAITSVQWLPTWELTRNSIRGQGLPYDLAGWGSLPLSGWKLFFNPLNRVELNKISFNLGGGPAPNPFDHFSGYAILLIAVFLILKLSGLFIGKIRNQYKVDIDFWFYLVTSLIFFWIALGNSISLSLHRMFYILIPFYRFIRIPIQNLIYPVVLIPLMTAMILNLIKNKWLKVSLGALLIFQLFSFKKDYIFLTETPERKFEQKLLEEIKMKIGQERLLPNFRVISPILDKIDLNSPMKLGIQSTGGYDPLILKNYYDFIDRANGNTQSSISQYNVEIPPIIPEKKTLDLLNVGKILKEDGQVVQNENYLSRFYFDLDEKCQEGNNQVELLYYSLNSIKLKTNSYCDENLLSSEVYYPGWQAKIDGRKADILSSNIAFRTIFVPEGEHLIEYYYYPKIYLYGLVISILSLFLFLKIKNVQA